MGCRRCLVSGHVQGVFFRASARQQAMALGLTGYARNLPDGRVEVLACGDEAALQALQAWLRKGPAHAHVSGVQCESVEVAVPPDFSAA
ncbi:MAG: acylphosphatase [Gammaproteobacteria bacterium]|jgi:acylphosphatase|nr:acylphosphatase [Gammaproteobacteria bacterium]